MIIDDDEIRFYITKTKIKVEVSFETRFSETEMFSWCREHFGKEKLVSVSDNYGNPFEINEKGVWDFFEYYVYFDKEEDATLFKLTWV